MFDDNYNATTARFTIEGRKMTWTKAIAFLKATSYMTLTEAQHYLELLVRESPAATAPVSQTAEMLAVVNPSMSLNPKFVGAGRRFRFE